MSTPHRSETNGIGERAVCRVKEWTSAVLLRSGLGNELWADSVECCCYLRNIQDLLSDRKTPHEMRFGMPFNGPVIPFEQHTISVKDLSRLHQFGSKVLPGMFLGYVLSAKGIWKGDIMVADIEELEEMDASELHARRLNAKEVLTPKPGEFAFPFADGSLKISGEDQDLRRSTQESDFAGDLEDTKSISGGILCIFGSHTFVPKSWMCNKQTSVCHSSTDAEIFPLTQAYGWTASQLWIFGIWS